jgi:hypothetical protein
VGLSPARSEKRLAEPRSQWGYRIAEIVGFEIAGFFTVISSFRDPVRMAYQGNLTETMGIRTISERLFCGSKGGR